MKEAEGKWFIDCGPCNYIVLDQRRLPPDFRRLHITSWPEEQISSLQRQVSGLAPLHGHNLQLGYTFILVVKQAMATQVPR